MREPTYPHVGLAAVTIATPSIFDEENRRVFRIISGDYEFNFRF